METLKSLVPTSNNQQKGLFNQPGGTLGIIFLAGITGLILFNIDKIIKLFENTLYAIGMGAAIFVIVFLLLDPKFRKALGVFYMLLMKKLTGLLVNIDPISIIENAVEKMEKSIANMEKNMGKLNGIRLKLTDKIAEKKKLMDKSLKTVQVAKDKGNEQLAAIESRQAVRLGDLIETYIDLKNSADKWYNTLNKLSEMAKMTVQDAKNEVEVQKEKYEIVKSSYNSFKSALSAIYGDPDELAISNMAMDAIQNDVMSKLGEMDRLINTTGGIIDKVDVEKEVFALKGKDILEKYEQVGIDGIFEKFEKLPSGKVLNVSNIKVTPVAETSNKYF